MVGSLTGSVQTFQTITQSTERLILFIIIGAFFYLSSFILTLRIPIFFNLNRFPTNVYHFTGTVKRKKNFSPPLTQSPPSRRRPNGPSSGSTLRTPATPSVSLPSPPWRASFSPAHLPPFSGWRSAAWCPASPSATSWSLVTRVCTQTLPVWCSGTWWTSPARTGSMRLSRTLWPLNVNFWLMPCLWL